MKKNIFFIIPVVIISLLACAQTKKTTTQKTSKLKVDYVQMRRTACFGKCPIYNIEVFKNGRITYRGVKFVSDTGMFEKNIGTAAAAKLLNQFTAYRVDTCSESYYQNIADLPGIYYNFTFSNDAETKITNAEFGPYFLKVMAKKMDTLAAENHTEKAGWKRVSYK